MEMKTFTVGLVLAMVAGIGVQSALAQSKSVTLITDEESTLPALPETDLKFRAGVSRGPSIVVVSPKPGESELRSPFRLQMKFEGRGGAQVDPDSLKLTYNKKTSVDLTPRVKPYVLASGVDLPEAAVPPGQHSIRAEIKDKDGRTGSVIFIINVVK
jgi:hypothetical protein